MSCLLADVGGTNTRCAMADPGGAPRHLRSFRNREFRGLPAILEAYRRDLPAGLCIDAAMLAVAAPIRGEQVSMINIDWAFSATAVADALGVARVELLNDFEALAHALPELGDAELLRVGGGNPAPRRTKVVLGPGTGLGVACLVPAGEGWLAVSGEGGHVSLAANSAAEDALISEVRARLGHCSAERLVSGPGLTLIHELLHGEGPLDAAEIGDRLEGGDAGAAETFEVLFRLLGTVASNLALTVGAFGGVYIGGGIVPRHALQFARSGFRARFEAKGRYAAYLQDIPTFVITAADPTLLGLAARL
jgi:glucokinase